MATLEKGNGGKNKKVVSKEDLRRLMKAQKTSVTGSDKRVDSPLAKYNSLGELSCVVCCCPIKTEILWNAHILGRSHKENVAKMKCGSNTAQPFSLFSESLSSNPFKRKGSDIDTLSSKDKVARVSSSADIKLRPSSSGLPADFFDGPLTSTRPTMTPASRTSDSDESSSGDDNLEDEKMDEGVPIPAAVSSTITLPASSVGQLPPDFFDPKVPVVVAESAAPTITEKLPEGFFDDPKMDAKVRQVVYRDKMEEEWDSFQKAMKEEAVVSEALLEEDDDKRDAERNIDEIDEQLNRWTKVDRLLKKKDEIMTQAATSETSLMGKKGAPDDDEDSSSDIDPAEFDEILDWRCKKAWK